MSSELFSSSGLFLGQNLSLDLGHYANGISAAHCNEVMQGKTHVPVPPGKAKWVNKFWLAFGWWFWVFFLF